MNTAELDRYASELEKDRELRELLQVLRESHGGQMYGGVSYIYHLLHTSLLGEEHGFYSLLWRKTFLLHDSVEDTSLTLDWIRERHGDFVASHVDAVTGTNGSRREHCAVQREKIERLPTAAIVKSLDRLSHYCNLEAHFQEDVRKFSRLAAMYEKEADEFEEMVMGKIPSDLLVRLVMARETLALTACD